LKTNSFWLASGRGARWIPDGYRRDPVVFWLRASATYSFGAHPRPGFSNLVTINQRLLHIVGRSSDLACGQHSNMLKILSDATIERLVTRHQSAIDEKGVPDEKGHASLSFSLCPKICIGDLFQIGVCQTGVFVHAPIRIPIPPLTKNK
jgi:hypothetical protein